MGKTKKPSGLAIARDGYNFTCTWKIGDSDYGDGQQFEYRTKGKTGWRKWNSVSCGKTATSKKITLTANDFQPVGSGYILSFEFRVRGNRKTYTKGSGKKKKTIKPGWSDWSCKVLNVTAPPVPNLSAELSGSFSNVTTFSWSLPTASASQIFKDIEWQTALVMDCNYTDGSKAPYGSAGTAAGSGSSVQTENTSQLANGHSYTRWFRARSRGPAGNSAWAYAKHVYAAAAKASNTSAKVNAGSGGLDVSVNWNSSSSAARPVDSIVVQKVTTVPNTGITCPAGASWTDVTTLAYKSGTDGLRYVEGATVSNDECLFVRVNTVHDGNTTYGTPALAKAGALAPPSNVSVVTNDSNFKATVSATNNSNIADSFLAVIYQGSNNPNKAFVAGIIPHGQSSVVIQCPNWSGESAIAFGVYAVVGSYQKQTRADGADSYAVYAYSGKPLMTSEKVWEGGNVPKAPTGVSVTETGTAGTVLVRWNWTWADATGAELSWADHADAWESTNEPSSYTVSNMHSAYWNISGLETGKRWYVRVRLVREVGDSKTFGPWSETLEIDLATAPMIPVLSLSSPVITEDGETTAYWSYMTMDGTSQAYAEICLATITSSGITYGQVIARTQTALSTVLKASELGWSAGQTYNLCVRVTSESGKRSDGWSAPVPIRIAEKVTCQISSTSLENVTVSEDDDEGATRQILSLTEMPLEISIAGAGDYKVATVAIERASDYQIERPDGDDLAGYEGETVALISQTGSDPITVAASDLSGRFDDGAQYRIVATVQDSYGQCASDTVEFEVHWDHQAIMPAANVVVDDRRMAVLITPAQPQGAENTDRTDIYRLSADKPVLIVAGAEFGTTYVDPYPALGRHGGHRVVFVTKDGDYITADNRIAWIDIGEEDGDIIEQECAVIDFDGEQVVLKYNINVSHSWQKDFVETKYLGGSVQGDWNPGISRKSNVESVVVRTEDAETIEAMRRLSVFAGVCNIRTPDGSSFAADIQVSEDSSHDSAGKIVKYKLTISRVDPVRLDGMLRSEWDSRSAHLVEKTGNYLLDNNGAHIIVFAEEE